MRVEQINAHLLRGEIDEPGVLPHVASLSRKPLTFRPDFGLDALPEQPGLLVIRGPRQFGKSTWLEQQIATTIEAFGPGTAAYLNGDEITTSNALMDAIREVLTFFAVEAPVRRLFIDEITAVDHWERAIKRLADAGELEHVLLVTTGSNATDLRRGTERLPGRKGQLERSSYLFTPLSYAEFHRVAHEHLGDQTLTAYLLSGGSPVACSELALTSRIPEYVVELVRDWVNGECARSGRPRASLLAVLDVLLSRGGSPVGQSKLAREAGLANNTVAAGYLELLADLMCVGSAYAWDASKKVAVRRRPAKFPLTNLLVATAWHPARVRSIDAFEALGPEAQAPWLEWLVAQELWRRKARRGEELPEALAYWQSDARELDFVVAPDLFVEVKRGRTSPVEFGWFAKQFPRAKLLVVGQDRFETQSLRGLTMEDFLLDETW